MNARGRLSRALAATALAMTGLATTALGGCAVGPKYAVPALPAGAAAPLATDAVDPTAPPDAWWRLYADPRLDAYVAEALDPVAGPVSVISDTDYLEPAHRTQIEQAHGRNLAGIQSMITSAPPPAMICSGAMSGPPGLIVTSRLASL